MIRHPKNSLDKEKYFKKLKCGGQKCNFVCVKHRTNKKDYGPCPICRVEMISIGDRYKVPPKDDDKGWEKLERDFAKRLV
jgi:hypothetical protein